MSTDQRKKNRGVPRIDRIKLLEYGCIGLVVLLFVGLAILYGGKRNQPAPDTEAEIVPTPVPTSDPSIRGKNVLDAIEASDFTLTYVPEADSSLPGRYELVSESGVSITMHMQSDDKGITELSVETLLNADPDGDTEIAATVRLQNKATTNALRDLFDLLMPVFHRTVSDSDTIVKQCLNVVKTGEPYTKHLGRFSVRILSDPEEIPQTVTILLIRDP